MRVPATKLRRPRLGYSVIDRSWLLERPPNRSGAPASPDDGAESNPVTLVSAPPGSGKTTLLSGWAQKCARDGRHVAWVTLDAHDNDRALFWAALLAAVRDSVDRRPETSASPSEIDVSAEQLADRQPRVQLEALVSRAEAPVWLFLDDLHKVCARDVLDDIEALLRARPAGLRLIIATRRDPAVAVTRLLLSGELREIRAADLALDRGDVRQLLADHGVVLDESLLTVLMERTEGWATGVRLAALALSRADDPRVVVARFAADGRAVADYLAAEVFAHLAPADLALLRACAVPEQLTLDLAVALTGDRSVTTLLEDLHRDNVLVVRVLDGDAWFRLHTLLRSYLIAELQRAEPDLLPVLHDRCARWLADHGHVATALRHAVATGQRALAGEMFMGIGPTLLADGRELVLRRLLDSADPAVLSQPGVRQLADLVDLRIDHPERASSPARTASDDTGASPSEEEEARSAALEALVTLKSARFRDQRLSASALAASQLAPGDPGDDVTLLTRQSRGILLTVLGKLDDAEAEFAAALRLAVESDNDHAVFAATTGFLAVAGYRCDFRRAAALAEETIERARQRGLDSSPATAFATLHQAHVAYEDLDHEGARDLLALALHDSQQLPEPVMAMWATGFLANLDVRTGQDPSQAARRLRDCWSVAGGRPSSPFIAARLAYAQHRCSWLVGRPDWAQEALSHLDDHVGPGGESDVLHAAEHLARGRGTAARRRLRPVLDDSVPCLMPTTLQQGLLMEAVLAAAAGQGAHAHDAVRRALEIADETGAAHTFLDVPGVTDLLEDDSGRFGRLDPLADRIRSAARAQSEREHIPLTMKELELLSDLPAPLTFEEIAERHQVSINTVKTHVRSIYQKLDSGSRRHAIAAARRRGML